MKSKKILNICTTIAVTIGFALLGAFVFRISYLRTFEALTDLLGSLKYYFGQLFGLSVNAKPSVIDYSQVIRWELILPDNFEAFKTNFIRFWQVFASKDNFLSWLEYTGENAGGISKILIIILPCALALFLAIKTLYNKSNTKHNHDTLPLRIFKKMTRYTYVPIREFSKQYLEYVKQHSAIWIVWLLVWVFNLNLASIFIAFFAYYFYFAVSFDFVSIYVQFVKAIMDLQVIVKYVPMWVLIIVGYMIFEHIRKKSALNKLRKYEAKNCGFINELPIVSMTCGSMGKRKTTMITDMTLSQEVMFRQKAFDILKKADMKFPYFPWICFEKELAACMEYGTVYNLATVKEWVKLKHSRYEKHGNTLWQLYGYDCQRYGLIYDDALKTSELFDVLETYAQAFFIYALQTSLIVANYSIRTDNILLSQGNFPLWALDFFANGERENQHAHILDFDVLRLGKKVLESNPKAGSFEFGVVAITEIGKERGNNLELREVKKKNDETNQKNDLFNSWLKMCRHSATVDNFPFIKVFTDEQRPESWGADARDLCDIVNIVSAGEQRLALPFYTIEDMLSEIAFNRFIALYYDFRYRRGDNTLLVYILKTVTAWLWKRNARIYNKYGYSIVKIEKERGTMDGKPENKRYFLMNFKIYRNRFTTDCFSDYFNDMAGKTNVGLMDYIEYATEKASVEELKAQNSYFINGLYRDEEGA